MPYCTSRDVVALACVEWSDLFPGDEVRESNHRCQRSSQLVRHIGEEFALMSARRCEFGTDASSRAVGRLLGDDQGSQASRRRSDDSGIEHEHRHHR